MNTENANYVAELGSLESQVNTLEGQLRALGLTVPQRPDVAHAKATGATLDEIFSALGAMESHAAQLRTTARLSTPLAYAPKSVPKTAAQATAKLTPMQQIEAAGGVKVMNLKSEIARLEAVKSSLKAGSNSARAVEGRIANLKSKLAAETSGK